MSTAKSELLLTGRDLRLDFFRGLALFSIFIDHIPNNICNQFTVQAFGIYDAAEVFILISGYAAGMAYGGTYQRDGIIVATAKTYQRVWQLYVAHIFMFMLFMAIVAQALSGLNQSLFAEEYRAADFLTVPDVAIIKALTLQFQPVFMDILPLYIVLLGMLPLALLGFRHAPRLTFAVIAAVWLAAQLDPRVALPAYPGGDHVWFFNPFAWQALFLLGAFLGFRGLAPAGMRPPRQRWIFRLSLAVTLVFLAIKVEWTISDHFLEMTPISLKALGPFLSKTDMSPLRFANVLAIATVVAYSMKKQSPILGRRFAYPFLVCGRHSLEIFCLGILLSVIAHYCLTKYLGNEVMQIVASIAGIALMVIVAVLIEWIGKLTSKRQPAAPATARVTGEVQ